MTASALCIASHPGHIGRHGLKPLLFFRPLNVAAEAAIHNASVSETMHAMAFRKFMAHVDEIRIAKGDDLDEKVREDGAEWDAKLYNAKHDFVWKYGSDVVSLLDPRAGEAILDLGCGTGHLTAQIAESGAKVTGVDRSAEMVRAARWAYPKLEFEISDARNLPYRNQFEAVFSNATLHWIHEPELVLQEVWKALRPGGRFVAEFGGKKNIRAMQEAFDQALVELGAAKPGEVQPWYYPSVSEYSTLAEKNGFEVRLITLFDRPTGLADGAAGMKNWIVMFCAEYLAKAGEAKREEFIGRVEEILRPQYFREGQWWADYRRLRLVAYK
jgi:trans-aconitate methyltransferase